MMAYLATACQSFVYHDLTIEAMIGKYLAMLEGKMMVHSLGMAYCCYSSAGLDHGYLWLIPSKVK